MKTMFGYEVKAFAESNSGSGGSYAARLEYIVRVGILEKDRSALELRLRKEVEFRFRAYGDLGLAWKREHGMALHPLVFGDTVLRDQVYHPGLKRKDTDEFIFTPVLAPTMTMESIYRNDETTKVLAFVAKCIDYPDNGMSKAANERFDVIRDHWYGMDAFAQLLWTLHDRGARRVELNQDAYHFHLVSKDQQASSENMMRWIYNSERMARNTVYQAERAAKIEQGG